MWCRSRLARCPENSRCHEQSARAVLIAVVACVAPTESPRSASVVRSGSNAGTGDGYPTRLITEIAVSSEFAQ